MGFTAAMEDELELVAENKKNWKEIIRDFWKNFIPTVEAAEKEAFVPRILTDIDCPNCGHKLQKIWARKKYFYGCSNYPECEFTTSAEALDFKKEDYDPTFNWDQPCPKCASPMKVRHGKFGAFLGCSRYPECRGLVNIAKAGEPLPADMPTCPAIDCDGKMIQRRSRFGKPFFSCSNYPDCDVIVNNLDDLEQKYQDHPKTPYKSKRPKASGVKRVLPKKRLLRKKSLKRVKKGLSAKKAVRLKRLRANKLRSNFHPHFKRSLGKKNSRVQKHSKKCGTTSKHTTCKILKTVGTFAPMLNLQRFLKLTSLST